MLTVSTISHPLLFAPFVLEPGSDSRYRETLWAEDNGALRQLPVATETKSSLPAAQRELWFMAPEAAAALVSGAGLALRH